MWTPRRALGLGRAAAQNAAPLVALVQDGAAVHLFQLKERNGRQIWPFWLRWLDNPRLNNFAF